MSAKFKYVAPLGANANGFRSNVISIDPVRNTDDARTRKLEETERNYERLATTYDRRLSRAYRPGTDAYEPRATIHRPGERNSRDGVTLVAGELSWNKRTEMLPTSDHLNFDGFCCISVGANLCIRRSKSKRSSGSKKIVSLRLGVERTCDGGREACRRGG